MTSVADLRLKLDAATRTWHVLAAALGAKPTDAADDVITLARNLAADRGNNPELGQLSPWAALPTAIPRDELERRIALVMTHLHWTACGHASTAFLILRDGVPPTDSARCAPKGNSHD